MEKFELKNSDQSSPPPPYPGTDQSTPYPAPPYPTQEQPKIQMAQPNPPNPPYPPAQPMPQPMQMPGPPPPNVGFQKVIVTQQPQIQPSGTTTIILNAPTAVRLGVRPVYVQCSSCHQMVYTKTESEPSNKACGLCAILCILGINCGCCLIPLFMDDWQDVTHRCPNCNHYIGVHKA